MKIAWLVLLISAFTDFVITTATSLTTAMMVMGNAELPSNAVVIVASLGGAVTAARTIQQGLRSATSEPPPLTTQPQSRTVTEKVTVVNDPPTNKE